MRLFTTCSIILFSIHTNLFAQVPDNITQNIVDGNDTYTLTMTKESLRGPHFNVKVQNAIGSYDDYTPGEIRTYIGTVAELPDALVTGYLQTVVSFGPEYTWTAVGFGLLWAAMSQAKASALLLMPPRQPQQLLTRQ